MSKRIKILLIIISSVIIIVLLCIFLLYNSKYFIKLNGDETIILKLNEEYNEKGAETIFGNKVDISGKVDNTKIGIQKVKYCFKNSCRYRYINIIDSVKPKMVLNGYSELNILLNGQYIEEGVSAVDNYDGDISDKVVIKSNLDLTKCGDYEITYEVTDSSGNKESINRVIHVNESGPLSLSIADFSLEGYFKGTILEETEDMGQEYIDETIFYGDSITFNLFYYGQLYRSNVWAMSNLTPENALIWKVPFYRYEDEITLIDGLKKYKPKRLIINLGANAVAVMTKDYFISNYEKLISLAKEASPETIIIIESIFPVDNRYNNATSLNNTKINIYNYYLAEVCERQKVYFLNTAEVLKNSEGYLRNDYCYVSDGIHLTPAGNMALVDYVRRHGK